MKPYAAAWQLSPPAGLDADHQAIYDKLNGLSGTDFDKAYMEAMWADHHKALDASTREAGTTTKDPKFEAAVVHGKGVVAGHTSMADSLNGTV